MTNSQLIITALIGVIVVLVAIIISGRNKKVSEDSNNNIVQINNGPKVAEVDSIVLQNALGQEMVLRKPEELTDAKYMQVSVSGAGNVIQHVGQGAGNIYTLKELSNIAGKELYTHPLARTALHDYGGGKYSSTIWGQNGKIASHEGFQAFDASKALAGVNPVMITMVVMQGMAIVSGQYFLKQINTSMQAIGKDIQELKEIHEAEKRGTLTHCRNRLMEISQMSYYSEADIIEIRGIANDAGKILEEYKDRYYSAKQEVEQFQSFARLDRAMNEYNNKLYKMRYLLQVCMIADRILDEARLTEFVVRRRMNVADPAIQDVYNRMEDNYKNGFNATVLAEIEETSQTLLNRGWKMIDESFAPSWNVDLIKPVEENISGMKEEVFNFTASVRRVEEDHEEQRGMAVLLSDNEEPQFFIEIPDDLDDTDEEESA